MNSFIYDLYGRLTNESRNLVEHGKRKTLTALDIQSVRPSPAALPHPRSRTHSPLVIKMCIRILGVVYVTPTWCGVQAVRLVLPGDLRAHAIAEGTQALTRLTGKRMSKK